MTGVAVIQMASGPNPAANMQEAGRLIDEAVKAGARLCVLPENFALMPLHESELLNFRELPGDGPIQAFLSQQASKHGIWLVGGTIPLRADAEDRVRAACLVFNDQGRQVARYDKMHLFDVTLSEKREDCHCESNIIEAGREPVVVDTPFGKLGLAVCYDLRFPELFRYLSARGAELFCLPAAFTALTGQAHWKSLLCARAIENQAYILASGQGGYHVNGRETYGDSMIIDAWGTILARKSRNAGFAYAEYDRNHLLDVRRRLPALEHRIIDCCLDKT